MQLRAILRLEPDIFMNEADGLPIAHRHRRRRVDKPTFENNRKQYDDYISEEKWAGDPPGDAANAAATGNLVQGVHVQNAEKIRVGVGLRV